MKCKDCGKPTGNEKYKLCKGCFNERMNADMIKEDVMQGGIHMDSRPIKKLLETELRIRIWVLLAAFFAIWIASFQGWI